MSRDEFGRPDLERYQRPALIIGVAGLALALVGALFDPARFFRAYLFAYLFWLEIALGCLAIVMLIYFIGSTWGLAMQRFLEAGTTTLPLMAVLFLPLLLGLDELYLWTRPEVVAADPLLQHKQLYLNVPFFLARLALYFAIWIGLAFFLNRWSREQERDDNPALGWSLRRASGPGIVLYALAATFASFDWMMSLEPHWFSTIYGMMFVTGQVLAALAFVTMLVAQHARRPPLSDVITPRYLNDLGNLLLAAVLSWAYIAYSQFVVIWFGNIAEETPWYLRRMSDGWGWIAIALVVFHFAAPFVLLLFRGIKRQARYLLAVAAVIFFMHLVNVYWMIMPAFYPVTLTLHWLDIVLPVGIGGLWIAVYLRQLKGRSLLPGLAQTQESLGAEKPETVAH